MTDKMIFMRNRIMKKYNNIIQNIILIIILLFNILMLQFIWWELDNENATGFGFADAKGWRYFEIAGVYKREVYIMGLLLMFIGIWLFLIQKAKIISILSAVIGSIIFIAVFIITYTNNEEYYLLKVSNGHFTDNYKYAVIYGIVSAMLVIVVTVVRAVKEAIREQ